jgi:hypothetical protein
MAWGGPTAGDGDFDDPKLTRELSSMKTAGDVPRALGPRRPGGAALPSKQPAMTPSSVAPAQNEAPTAALPTIASPAALTPPAALPAIASPIGSSPITRSPTGVPTIIRQQSTPGSGAAASVPGADPPLTHTGEANSAPVFSGSVDVATKTVSREPPTVKGESAGGPWPYAPRMKLAYRRFPFTRVGATTPTTPVTPGPSTPESFESLSLDLYPISWYLRVGLSTQFGWETGQFDRTGDYFVAESASVGFQIPGRFTPFVEALAGAGYMRRKQADLNLPTAYWQLGVDAGVEVYVAKRAYFSVAIGYLHPANLYLMQKSLMSVNADTWCLKFGLGI